MYCFSLSKFWKCYDNPTYSKERATIIPTNEMIDEKSIYLLYIVLDGEKVFLCSNAIYKMLMDAATKYFYHVERIFRLFKIS